MSKERTRCREKVLMYLFQQELGQNVEVDFDSSTKKLIFKFEERPLIKKVDIRSNKKISTGKIKEEIPLIEEEEEIDLEDIPF